MKRSLPRVLRALLFCSLLAAAHASFVWTGIGNGWKNQVPPPNDGTADLQLGDHVSTFIPIPSPAFSVNSVSFVSDNRFLFVPQSVSTTLTIGAGGMMADNMFGGSTNLDFSSGITVNLAAAQAWDFGFGGGNAIIHGVLGGSGDLTLTGSSNYNSTGLVLANTSATTTYSGNITLGNSTIPNVLPFVGVWASGNLGTGSLTFVNGGQLITHNATSLTNALILNSGPLPVGNNNNVFTPVNFKAWDAPMILSGNVTLANNTTINAQIASPNIPSLAPGRTGAWPLAGPRNRNPIIFTGSIGESGGMRSLNITGPGLVILGGTNTYTGGTNVGFFAGSNFNQQGNLIFGNLGAIPANGTLQSGLLDTPGASGYIGIATDAVPAAGNFNTFLTRFNNHSSGAVGLDSINSNVPSVLPSTYAENIDLSYFQTTNTLGVRFGTATRLIYTGILTPQFPTTYHFGNGGGRLYYQSGLIDQSPSVTSVRAESQGAFPLQLFLQAANSYTGGTSSSNGIVVFDGLNTIPVSGLLKAEGGSTYAGGSYIGYTGTTSVNGGPVIGTSFGDFFAKFDQANTWGIIGFDTHYDTGANTWNATVTIPDVNLTGFNDGVFIGTNSSAILSGTITPTSVANVDQLANVYRFTAVNGGTLTISSALADITTPASVPRGVVLGSFAGTPAFSDGTIILNGANTYSMGTMVNNHGNLSLVAGSSSAFGQGTILLQPHGGVLALSAGTTGLNLPNAIVFAQADPMTGFTPVLNLTGSNSFTLSGNISGPDRSMINTQMDVGQGLIALVDVSPTFNATVSGDNSSYYGTFLVQNGTLTFATDNAPGRAQIEMLGSAATVAFTSANPVVHGLWNGDSGGGTITLAANTNLTVDTTDLDPDYNWDFGGALVGDSSTKLTLTANVNPADDTEFFYLYGSSPSFSGNIFVNGQSALALGKNDSVGTGAITINAVDGGVALNTGVTLTNPLVFNTGALAGIGTFAPSGVSGTGQTAGMITFGLNQMVFPGIPGEGIMPGKLTLATNVAFATGGEFALAVEDPAALEGFGTLNITGSLDLTSISTAGFIFNLESIGQYEYSSYSPAIVYGNSYSLRVITAAGGIIGFDPAKFTFDVSKFQDGLIPAEFFSVTADTNNLYLNFTAVPEPSTYALLALGLGFVGLTLWRRRQA